VQGGLIVCFGYKFNGFGFWVECAAYSRAMVRRSSTDDGRARAEDDSEEWLGQKSITASSCPTASRLSSSSFVIRHHMKPFHLSGNQ
jgi:hypothetical protein